MVEITLFSPKPIVDELHTLDQRTRYGRVLALLEWFYSAKISAPAAGSVLYSYTVSAGKKAYIYGFYVYATEANIIEIRWSHTPQGATTATVYDYPIYLGGAGTIHAEFMVAINEGKPADPGSTIEVINTYAGATGSTYKVGLLIGEI